MPVASTYSVYDLDTETLIARNQVFPRSGVLEGARRDPTNRVTNCPSDLKGPNGERYGWIREIVTRQPVGANQEEGKTIYGSPNFTSGVILVTIEASDLPAEEILENNKTSKIYDIKNKRNDLISAGFTYAIPGQDPLDPHTYSILDADQANMLAVQVRFAKGGTGHHGGFWRCASNHNVTMTDAEVQAFFDAAYAYKMGVIRNAGGLTDAARTAANITALNLIDVDAGTNNGRGGWPANGA